MSTAKQLLDTWVSVPRVISQREVKEIKALPTFDESLGMLDNVILFGWGRVMLNKYNADGRPAFAAFRSWAAANLFKEEAGK